MSKSYDNYIKIFEEPAKLKKQIGRITTDSKSPEEPKDPETSTIFQLYQNFSSRSDIEDMKQKFLNGGLGYGDAKKMLYQSITDKFEEPRKLYHNLLANKEMIDDYLKSGSEMARKTARITVAEVSRAMLGRSIS